jgi:hypothetical protein
MIATAKVRNNFEKKLFWKIIFIFWGLRGLSIIRGVRFMKSEWLDFCYYYILLLLYHAIIISCYHYIMLSLYYAIIILLYHAILLLLYHAVTLSTNGTNGHEWKGKRDDMVILNSSINCVSVIAICLLNKFSKQEE